MSDVQKTAPDPAAVPGPDATAAPTANPTQAALDRHFELRAALATATDPVVRRELTTALSAVVASLSPVEAVEAKPTKAPASADPEPEPDDAELTPDELVFQSWERHQAELAAQGFGSIGLGRPAVSPAAVTAAAERLKAKAKAVPVVDPNTSDVDAFEAMLKAKVEFGRSGAIGLGLNRGGK